MNRLNEILSLIDGYIGGSDWFVLLLLGTGIFFTLYLKFPQFRYLKHAIRIARGKFDLEGDVGDTSHFQALTTALSGTIGTGNIAGVALAIHLGGPAAMFWMLVTAVFGMTLKFVEVSISHKYREIAEDGTIAGGPMYFMRNRLKMKWLAIIFAVATVFSAFGTGCLPQINSISNSLFSTFGINRVLVGIVLAIILASVIIGGIKRIAKVTSRLVPIMAIFYIIGAFAVIAYNHQNILPAISRIFTDVFNGTAATGGFLGAGISYAFNRGVNRGLFSNEAGEGSAAIAHATAKAHEPISEGLVALLGPLIDTIIICSITGLVILTSGIWTEKIENQFQDTDLIILNDTYNANIQEEKQQLSWFIAEKTELPLFNGNLNIQNGIISNQLTIIHARSVAEKIMVFLNEEPYSGIVEVDNGKIQTFEGLTITGKSLIHSAPLTTEAFSRSWFGKYGSYIVSMGLLLFAFSTSISWSYYGDRAIIFLVGQKGIIYYRIVYVIGFAVAAFTDTTIIWTISGITVTLMTIPNLIGILILSKEMKQEVKLFWKEYALRFPNEKVPKN